MCRLTELLTIRATIHVKTCQHSWQNPNRGFQMTDEDLEAVGCVVEVVESVSSADQKGRVRFGGTTWPAVSKEGTIPKGRKAKLVLRDNLVWTVEPYDAEELPPSHTETIKEE